MDPRGLVPGGKMVGKGKEGKVGMGMDEKFYMYSTAFLSNDFDRRRGLEIHEATPGSRMVWDQEQRGFWLRMLRPATMLKGTQAGMFALDTGDGCGVPVFDVDWDTIGFAYSPYPRVCGVQALRGRVLWPRAPYMDEGFRCPVWMESLEEVIRVGDPSPGCVPFAMMNGLRSGFRLA
jgi:hypothetical protein